jgi:hypothetical protein
VASCKVVSEYLPGSTHKDDQTPQIGRLEHGRPLQKRVAAAVTFDCRCDGDVFGVK